MKQIISKNDVYIKERQLKAKGYFLHHTATRQGYVSRKTAGYIEPYNGRYGTGVRWIFPRYDTTRYCYVEYWIKGGQD